MNLVHKAICENIPNNSKVLDLGCGDGSLLEKLTQYKQINGYGIDYKIENITECIKKGLQVFQGNINEGLSGFSESSFDYVILSQTLQETQNPEQVIQDMLRIGAKGIVTFPNFAHWRVRLSSMTGISPKTKALPHSWYNTPNIRAVTINGFKKLCKKNRIHIIKEIPLYEYTFLKKIFNSKFTNFFSEKGMFILENQ